MPQLWIFHAAMTGPAVQVISHNPVSGRSKMNAQLMGSPGFGTQFEQRNMRPPGQNAISGNGRAAMGINFHLSSILAIRTYRQIIGPRRCPGVSPYEGQIGSVNEMPAQQSCQLAMSLVVARQQDQPCGSHIKPMQKKDPPRVQTMRFAL